MHFVSGNLRNFFLRGALRWKTSGIRTMAFSSEGRGSEYSFEYRIYFKKGDKYISPFHDIPLHPNPGNKALCNMIMEIPRWTNAKMEICVSEPLNPIKQDVKKGDLRFVCNCFPHHGYIWNYGALPQTWEYPGHTDKDTGCKGDNDPVDVCEIGSRVAKRGEVRQVKILGTLALIDEGETDWKMLAIDIEDPLADKLNDITDIESHMPGYIKNTVDFFKIYKMPTGKPMNKFAFNEEPKNRDFALRIVQETHEQWQNLVMKKCDIGSISVKNTAVEGSPDGISVAEAANIVSQAPPPGPPNSIRPSVDTWHYVKR